VNQTGADTPKLDTKSWALFGQATYSLTDTLRLIGGVRYTYENRVQAGTQSITAGPPTFLAQYPYITMPISGEIASRKATWKAGVEYDLSPRNMLFATVATGFKGGGVINAAVNNTYPPETLTAYELGSRNRFFDNTLQVNLEGFYWKYKNKQEGGIRYTAEDGVAFLITPGDAELYGVDLDLTWKPTPHDIFNLGGEYLHAKYTRFTFEGFVASYSPARTSCTLDYAHLSAAGGLPVDCSGKPLPKAPKWSGNASYDHIFALASGGSIDAGVSAQMSSSYWLNTDYNPVEHAKGFVTFDATLTWTDASGHFQIGLWGRNLTKRAVYTGGIQEPFKDGVFYTSIKPPRTYGLRVGYKF
jgi:iron complex outermembrane receptor protein